MDDGHAIEDLIGTEIPTFTRRTSIGHWNRFAAVNDEFVGIHMDDEAGKAAGLPGAIGMGNLQVAYLHNVLRSWIGDQGRIVRFACRFRAPNLKDTTVHARGMVKAIRIEVDAALVELDVWVESEDGTRLAEGDATVTTDASALNTKVV